MSKIDNPITEKPLATLSRNIKEVGISNPKNKKMTKAKTKDLLQLFKNVEDPRVQGRCTYDLAEVLLLVFLATLGNSDTWVEISNWGKIHITWLRKFSKYKNGIPSHDQLNYIFGKIDQSQLQKVIVTFLKENIFYIKKALGLIKVADTKKRRSKKLTEFDNYTLWNIDGKEERGTGRKYSVKLGQSIPNQQTLHVWDYTNDICLYAKHITEKTNEIPIAQEFLLEQPDLSNTTITGDAIHCQRKTVELIKQKNGDYLFGLKGNQSELKNNVALCFTPEVMEQIKKEQINYNVTVEKAHSQIETRETYYLKPYDDPERTKKWGEISGFICQVKTIEPLNPEKKKSVEIRYYITSLKDPKLAAKVVRLHWHCESSHWILDKAFNEDGNRTANINSYQNLTKIHKMVLAFLKLLRTLPKYNQQSYTSLRKMITSPESSDSTIMYDLFLLIGENNIEETLNSVKFTANDKKKALALLEKEKYLLNS